MLIFFPSRLWKRRRFCRRHLPGRRRWLGRQRRFLFLLFPNPPPSLSLPPSPSNFTFLLLFPLTAGAALWRPQRHLLPPGIATGSGGLTLLRAYFAESATRERWRSGLRAPALPRLCPGSAPSPARIISIQSDCAPLLSRSAATAIKIFLSFPRSDQINQINQSINQSINQYIEIWETQWN